MKIQEFNFKN